MYDELVRRLRAQADAERYFVGEDMLYDKAADAIEELSATVSKMEKATRWVPVTERLPKKMQYVLVRYKNNDMAVASWFGGDEHIRFWRAMTDEGWCADCDTEPTHWMPLPEPPREES